MFTARRLTKAYNSARIEHFDNNSKYVFLSDCHRGNGNLADEFTKNQNIFIYALEHYYKEGYTYVEVGDGDELWEHPRFRSIKNAHIDAFNVIKKFFDENRFILIYGNHNIYLKDEEYVKSNYYTYHSNYFAELTGDFLKGLKPIEALVLKHIETGQEILTLHGHQGDGANDLLWRINMFSFMFFWRFMHAFGVKNPVSPINNTFKIHKIEKRFCKWIKKNKKMIICGHTHRLRYPDENDLPYFNTGSCVYPTSITAIEIENGNISLAWWRVVANSEGLLQITREIMVGPNPIEKFDMRDTQIGQARYEQI
jgi:UDP-2,3-diacylglucosamine pyrophosphatase LpxH